MDAVAVCTETPKLQRATGELLIRLKRRGAGSGIEDLRQAGCLKARFPRHAADGWTEVVVLNTSGGVVGGDELLAEVHLGPAARAVIATQAAERCYRALQGSDPATIRASIHVTAGACAEWLPQETILFDRCSVDRTLDVELAHDARFLGLEMLVFGRAAMGEQVTRARLRDAIRIRRGGRWLLHEAVRLDGDVQAAMRRPAVAGGAHALATLVHVAPDAEAKIDDVRAAFAGAPVEAGASAWNGMLLVRMLAPDAAALRRAAVAVLSVLRAPRPLPRVWLC